MPRKRPQKNLLANRTASVSIHRNGLQVEIASVPASDAGLVSQALMDMVRNLVEAGYDELLMDAGGVHGGALGEAQDDDEGAEWTVPPTMQSRRPIGF